MNNISINKGILGSVQLFWVRYQETQVNFPTQTFYPMKHCLLGNIKKHSWIISDLILNYQSMKTVCILELLTQAFPAFGSNIFIYMLKIAVSHVLVVIKMTVYWQRAFTRYIHFLLIFFPF